MKSCKLVTLVTLTTLGFLQASSVPDIFAAIKQADKKAVKAWIKSKPDFSIKNIHGKSAVTLAVVSGDASIVRMLLKAHVPVNEVDISGRTALDYALEKNQEKIVFLLLKHKAKFTKIANQAVLQKMLHKRAVIRNIIFGFFAVVGVGVIALSFVVFASAQVGALLVGSIFVLAGSVPLAAGSAGLHYSRKSYKNSELGSYLLNTKNSISEK